MSGGMVICAQQCCPNLAVALIPSPRRHEAVEGRPSIEYLPLSLLAGVFRLSTSIGKAKQNKPKLTV